MGVQGAGKSSLVRKYTDRGYARLNRDLQGGKLEDLVDELDRLLDEGEQRVVLDNTYPTMSSRWSLIRKAHRYGIPVRCRHIATPLDQAYINVCLRMHERYDRMLGPDEMKTYLVKPIRICLLQLLCNGGWNPLKHHLFPKVFRPSTRFHSFVISDPQHGE